ncbi:hypothetical protein ACVBEQ_12910 [Nakamurella sp. GG22]
MTIREDAHALESARQRLYVMTAIDAALRRYPEVVAAVAGAADRAAAQQAVQEVLQIDELQATAVLEMQFSRLTADQIRAVADDCAELTAFVESAGPGAPE